MTEERIEYKVPSIEDQILFVRGQKVILDSDLARIYGVPTKRLNEQVRRNKARFPIDFVFKLNQVDLEMMNRSQFATGSQKHRDPRFSPYVFTEHGALMASTILNSQQAIKMSVYVIRAFVRLREALAIHKNIARKLDALEKKVGDQDAKIQAVFDAIREMMKEPEKPKKKIGFLEEQKDSYRVKPDPKIHRNAVLRFTKPTAQEDQEIRRRYAEMKKGKSVVMRPMK
jgi:hypothetical protein